MSQIGSALVEMQKNVGTIKQAKDELSSLSPAGGNAIKKEGARTNVGVLPSFFHRGGSASKKGS